MIATDVQYRLGGPSAVSVVGAAGPAAEVVDDPVGVDLGRADVGTLGNPMSQVLVAG